LKQQGYKEPGEESEVRLQYHSQNSRGSRRVRPTAHLEAAELLRMALDVLGSSI